MNKTLEELATKILFEDDTPDHLKDFMDLNFYGETLYYRDGQRIDPKDIFIGDADYTIRTAKLSGKEILEKYKDYLTYEEKEKINNNGKGISNE